MISTILYLLTINVAKIKTNGEQFNEWSVNINSMWLEHINFGQNNIYLITTIPAKDLEQ